MNTRLTGTLGALAALVVAATLTGCAPSDDDVSVGTPTPATEPPEVSETVYGECLDGVATILADDLEGPFELGDCATVSVVGVDGEITLGSVDRLVLEGDRNTIVVASVGDVAFGGNDNVVEHGGDAPQVVDEGEGNTVEPTG